MNARHDALLDALPWAERNQRWLAAALVALRARLQGPAPGAAKGDAALPDVVLGEASAGFTPALDRCAQLFGLSAFERELLLLAAGIELDAALQQAVAASPLAAGGAPSFSLALAHLSGPHWDAISPLGPLRHWRLLGFDGPVSTRAALHIDERVLHFLTGVPALDVRLEGTVEMIVPPAPRADAAGWCTQVVAALSDGDRWAALAREPHDAPALRDAALQVLAQAGWPGLWLRAGDVPAEPAERTLFVRLVDREAAFAGALLVVEAMPADEPVLARIVAQLQSPVLSFGASPAEAGPARRALRVALPAPEPGERATGIAARARALGATADVARLRQALEPACRQFGHWREAELDAIARRVAAAAPDALDAAAWQALREAARGGLDELAQRIDASTGFDALVLPEGPRQQLLEITRQLRHRERVYRDWGFAAPGARGLGLAALFTGESGTGKTLAAEAIAHEARLDLYRIDLASTVSKYIGETEKNLKRLFDSAEASGAVLLFDEADALFGKRSDVKDSHDRYANIEVAYLLQRIESYRGLAILTTNMKGALDRAFLRRIRFVVQFPFPDEAARERIWRLQFPPRAPLGAIDHAALARLHLAGGNIRGVALHAAFKAADGAGTIDQRVLLDAARAELAKLERNPAAALREDTR